MLATVESIALITPCLERHGIRLVADQAARIERYGSLLTHWNRSINLVGNPERLYSRHLLDCLMLEGLDWPGERLNIVDIGSGAGMPGLVVALLHAQCRVEALEKSAKKATFLHEASRQLEIGNFIPLRRDAHQWAQLPEGQGRYDLALARAFAPLKILLELAGSLLRSGGRLWAFKGRQSRQEQDEIPAQLLERFDPAPGRFEYDFPELGVGGVILEYCKKGEAGDDSPRGVRGPFKPSQ